MTTMDTASPHLELLSLKRNSYLALSVGLFLGIESAYSVFNLSSIQSNVFQISIVLIALICIVWMLILLVRTIIALKKDVKSQSFWFAHYEDEFFSHIVKKGYKYAFNTTISFLGVIYLITGLIEGALLDISVKEFCKLTISIGFLAYSLPILYLIRGESE